MHDHPEKWPDAVHESGHAAAACCFGWPIRELSIQAVKANEADRAATLAGIGLDLAKACGDDDGERVMTWLTKELSDRTHDVERCKAILAEVGVLDTVSLELVTQAAANELRDRGVILAGVGNDGELHWEARSQVQARA